jgi:hypothetical protein
MNSMKIARKAPMRIVSLIALCFVPCLPCTAFASDPDTGVIVKKVFDAEETSWKSSDKPKPPVNGVNQEEVNKLLQPIRLEKLLSTDERLLTGFPSTLPNIAKAYVVDMEKEDQLKDVDPFVTKEFKGQLFKWVKLVLKEKGYSV